MLSRAVSVRLLGNWNWLNAHARLARDVATFTHRDLGAVQHGAVAVGASRVLHDTARAACAWRDDVVPYLGTASVATKALGQTLARSLYWRLVRVHPAVERRAGKEWSACRRYNVCAVQSDVRLEQKNRLHASVAQEVAAMLAVEQVHLVLCFLVTRRLLVRSRARGVAMRAVRGASWLCRSMAGRRRRLLSKCQVRLQRLPSAVQLGFVHCVGAVRRVNFKHLDATWSRCWVRSGPLVCG